MLRRNENEEIRFRGKPGGSTRGKFEIFRFKNLDGRRDSGRRVRRGAVVGLFLDTREKRNAPPPATNTPRSFRRFDGLVYSQYSRPWREIQTHGENCTLFWVLVHTCIIILWHATSSQFNVYYIRSGTIRMTRLTGCNNSSHPVTEMFTLMNYVWVELLKSL